MKGRAFSPGNITLFFGIIENKDPMKKGSIGVSFAVSKGAIAEAYAEEETAIFVNGKKKRFPTVLDAVRMLTDRDVRVDIKAQLPIGCGYGMSGACTLAALYVVNEALGLKRSEKSLALMAHKSEVINKTGLGSITAEYLGGVLMRKKKSSPVSAKKLKVKKSKLYVRSFGKLSTEKVITDKKLKKKISMCCGRAFSDIGKNPSMDELLVAGKIFGEGTGLLKDKRILKIIEKVKVKGGAATMNMLGKSVVATIAFPGSMPVTVSSSGAKLV